MTTNLKTILIYLCMLESINLQLIPENPCPNTFKYINNYGQVQGRIEFQNDNSGTYYLAVNMSVASYLGNDQNIKLELITSPNDIVRGAPLIYNVYFPIPSPLPRLTQIEFNGNMHCIGPPENLQPGGYVTNLYANTFFKLIVAPGLNSMSKLPLDIYEISPGISNPNLNSRETFATTEQIPVYSTTQSTIKPTHITPVPVDYSECGKPSIITIHSTTNGDNVEEGQCPWLAAVMFKSDMQYEYRCTATLVSDRHVITAGHCLQYGKAPLFPVEDLIVILGTASLENWALTGTIRGVSKISTHPHYTEASADNDVSVVTLNKPIDFTKNIRPICLWGNESNDLEEIVDKEGVVAGWGSDRPHGEHSPFAKRTNLPVVSQNVCLQSDIGFKSITSVRTFCAGRRDNTGPCTGDSGAGFAMFRNGRWILRGVISIPLKDGNTCDLENYLVFADLAQVKGWLSTTLV